MRNFLSGYLEVEVIIGNIILCFDGNGEMVGFAFEKERIVRGAGKDGQSQFTVLCS